MEIIKNGPQERGEQSVTFDCRNCKSQLKAKRKEGTENSDREGNYVVFVCPVCKSNCYISTSCF